MKIIDLKHDGKIGVYKERGDEVQCLLVLLSPGSVCEISGNAYKYNNKLTRCNHLHTPLLMLPVYLWPSIWLAVLIPCSHGRTIVSLSLIKRFPSVYV